MVTGLEAHGVETHLPNPFSSGCSRARVRVSSAGKTQIPQLSSARAIGLRSPFSLEGGGGKRSFHDDDVHKV